MAMNVVYVVYTPEGKVDRIFKGRKDAMHYINRMNSGKDEWKAEELYKIAAHVVHEGPLGE